MLEHALGTTLLCTTIVGLIVFLFLLGRRSKHSRSNDLETSLRALLKHDKRLTQIVTQLSFLHDLSEDGHLKGSLARKKMKLILEMRTRVKRYCPNSSPERIHNLCRRLLIISQTLSTKRHFKNN